MDENRKYTRSRVDTGAPEDYSEGERGHLGQNQKAHENDEAAQELIKALNLENSTGSGCGRSFDVEGLILEGVSMIEPETKKKERININGQTVWVTGTAQQRHERTARLMVRAGMLNDMFPKEQQWQDFASYARNWLETYKKGALRHTTLSAYNSILNCHLIPYFGKMSLHEISTPVIQNFLNQKAEEGYSRKSIVEHKRLLGMILDSAMQDGYVSVNHAEDKRLSINTHKKNERKHLTEAQYMEVASHITELANPSDRRFLALLVFTGMRRGEALGLRWSDINFEDNSMYIHNAITFHGNDPVEGPTKTVKGTRTVMMPEMLRRILLDNPEDSEFVVKDGVTSSYVKRMWERIAREINVYDVTPHGFRHSWTSHMNRLGIDDKTIQIAGGWGDAATMCEVYTHADHEDLRRAAETFDRTFKANFA